ncbi:hypothetical protein AMJ51_01980 [Microgenomates bacterium DG_75]|nr:MAG: hypothetical protein AMJ51_01980 [Microgenomates bacterium DG_75]
MKLNSILSTILVIVLVLSLCLFVFQNKRLYQEKFDFDYWDWVYSVSQWSQVYPEKTVSDAQLYTIAGSKYIRGEDPVNINPEHPPLGKYLIGVSIVLFKNEKIISLIIGILALLVFFFLAKKIFEKTFLAWLLVTLFSFEPLFRYQLKTTLLDLFQLFFALLAITFFLKAKKNLKFYFPTAILLGCVMATKAPVSGIILLVIFLFYLLLRGDFKGLRFLVICSPLILLVYLSSYLVHFFYNMNLAYFFRYQQWVADWWTGGNVSWGRVWRLLLTGWWHTWWEGPKFIRDSSWTIAWPLLTVCSLLSPIFYLRSKKDEKILLVILWALIYLGFLHTVAIFSRYLLFIFPGLYILTLFVLVEATQILAKLRYNLRRK